MHAVRSGAVTSGWAIDEDTMIEVTGDTVTAHGLGCAYRVVPTGGALHVSGAVV